VSVSVNVPFNCVLYPVAGTLTTVHPVAADAADTAVPQASIKIAASAVRLVHRLCCRKNMTRSFLSRKKAGKPDLRSGAYNADTTARTRENTGRR
jgi:hypothetical protein